jgi:hypothetical protein
MKKLWLKPLYREENAKAEDMYDLPAFLQITAI